MGKEEIIDLIAGRITDEYRKHPSLDWAKIAAGKLYSQWSEYFEATHLAKIRELEAEIERFKCTHQVTEKSVCVACGFRMPIEDSY